jgi:hypothetical protein
VLSSFNPLAAGEGGFPLAAGEGGFPLAAGEGGFPLAAGEGGFPLASGERVKRKRLSQPAGGSELSGEIPRSGGGLRFR